MVDRPYLPQGFEMQITAKRRRRLLAGQLARSAQVGAAELSAVLFACRRGHRCHSGACPTCQRKWRQAFLKEVDAALTRQGTLLRISWIPCGGRVPVGDLAAFDLGKFVASRRKALERALPGMVIYGGVDVSLNTTDNGGAIWQIHIYLVAESDDTPEIRESVLSHCPGEPTAARPFWFDVVADRSKVLSYAVKAEIYRRSGYVDKTGRRNAKPQRLGAEHAVEASIYQHRWPPAQRLVLRGMRHRRAGNRSGLRRLPGKSVVE